MPRSRKTTSGLANMVWSSVVIMNEISEHESWFAEYVERERAKEQGDTSPIDLKIRHTYRVLENASHIVEGEGFPLHLRRACLLAALYHDVARFEQYLQYHTFRDKDSFNHGRQGVVILKRENRLENEVPPIPHIVLAAVGLHNCFALPRNLPDAIRKATCVVRDADKLDILRIMDKHLSGAKPYNPTVVLRLPDAPDLVSSQVVNAVLENRVASYSDLKSVNDFRLLLGTWFHEMHFANSREQFLADGHARHLIEGIPDTDLYGPAKSHLLALLA